MGEQCTSARENQPITRGKQKNKQPQRDSGLPSCAHSRRQVPNRNPNFPELDLPANGQRFAAKWLSLGDESSQLFKRLVAICLTWIAATKSVC